MKQITFLLFAIFLLSWVVLSCTEIEPEKSTEAAYDVFSFEKKLTVPGTPEVIYDAITGDISGWWDHTFSESPHAFYIDPKPGGGFYEIFNENGDGVLHATVIYAQRGKILRFDGPLGLSGKAIKMVHTYTFEPVGADSTLLTLSVNASGEIEKNIPDIVKKVWDHFLFEQFKTYIEAGKHLE